MTWILIILAVNVNDPGDVPGKIWLDFADEASCRQSLNSLKYWIKFKNFHVVARCEPKKY
jgi:hypothetical protein